VKVRYKGMFDEVMIEVDGRRVIVQRNHQVEVPDEFGASLLEQEDNWEKVAPAPAEKAKE